MKFLEMAGTGSHFSDWDRALSLSNVMEREVLLLKISGDLGSDPDRIGDILERGLQYSREACWVVPAKDFLLPEIRDIIQKKNLKNLCVEFDLQGRRGAFPPEALKDLPATVRSLTAHRISETIPPLSASLSLSLSLSSLSIKVDLTEDHLPELLPALAYAMEKGIKTIFLDPSRLKLHSEKNGKTLKNIFEHLTIFAGQKSLIHFLGEDGESWNALTLNSFNGPKRVDIDTSNSCTHNCTFCGLYAPSVENSKDLAEFRGRKADGERIRDLLEELPPTLDMVVFGGLGDPFTHKNIMEFIPQALSRGFRVEVFTNFSYMTQASLETLHGLAIRKEDPLFLNFIVNFSGTTEETYLKTRPNQKAGEYQKIRELLQFSADLKRRDGRGLGITLLMVACRTNYKEIPSFVKWGGELGVYQVWIKPMEIHGAHTLDLSISGAEEEKDYAFHLAQALQMADENQVRLFDREMMEKIVEDHQEEGNSSFDDSKEDFSTKVQNGDLAKDYFSSHPCRVGHFYMRVNVRGEVLPCCVMGPVGTLNKSSFKDIWFSGSYQGFRSKMERIQEEKFHLHDPEWFVCQQCPHLGENRDFNDPLEGRHYDLTP